MLKHLRNIFCPSPSPKLIKQRETMYEQHFGSSPRIYHSTNRVFPHIDVYHFEPGLQRDFHTLITGGMADYRQPVDDRPQRLELIIYVKAFEWWAANLLKMVAEYPAQNNTFFASYHTVPIGYRLTDTSDISAFLLAPSEREDLQTLALSQENEPVDYLTCIPITMIEHAFAREVSSENLYSKLKDACLDIHREDERESVVDYKPQETDQRRTSRPL